jgi:hypothetical protein
MLPGDMYRVSHALSSYWTAASSDFKDIAGHTLKADTLVYVISMCMPNARADPRALVLWSEGGAPKWGFIHEGWLCMI